MVTGAAGAAFAARAAVLAPVGVAAALVGAKAASVEKWTAPATDVVAATPAETKIVPVKKFAALKPCGRAATSAEAEAAQRTTLVEGALAASARCKTASGDGSAARTSDGLVAAYADTVAVPVEGSRFAVSDNAVEETAASAIVRLETALAESALLCHVEHAETYSCMAPQSFKF